MTTPAGTSTNSKYNLLKELHASLETLIGFQKEEQEAILNRQTSLLPILSAKMDQLIIKVQGLERSLAGIWPGRPLPSPWDEIGISCMEKLKSLQEITLQNHLLLENSLRFLQEVFQEVIGASQKPSVYTAAGTMPLKFSGGGLFVNTQV